MTFTKSYSSKTSRTTIHFVIIEVRAALSTGPLAIHNSFLTADDEQKTEACIRRIQMVLNFTTVTTPVLWLASTGNPTLWTKLTKGLCPFHRVQLSCCSFFYSCLDGLNSWLSWSLHLSFYAPLHLIKLYLLNEQQGINYNNPSSRYSSRVAIMYGISSIPPPPPIHALKTHTTTYYLMAGSERSFGPLDAKVRFLL